MYEFNLPSAVPVEQVFCFLASKLSEISKSNGQTYQDMGFTTQIDKDTAICLNGASGGYYVSGPLYYVNPHIGQFDNPLTPYGCNNPPGSWIPIDKRTNHVTVIPRIGKPLTGQQVEEIKKELKGLK